MTDLRERLRLLERNPYPEVWHRVATTTAPTMSGVDDPIHRRWPAAAVAIVVAAAALTFGFAALRPTGTTFAGGGLSGTLTYYVAPLDMNDESRGVVDLATGESRQQTLDPDDWGTPSPDGTKAVRVEQRGRRVSVVDISGETNVEIRSFHIDGIALEEIGWSPDGDAFAFLGQDADGSGFVRVAEMEGAIRDVPIAGEWDAVAWSPDRTTFALAGRDAADRYGVFVAPAEGGTPTLLAEDNGFERHGMAWSPDSSTIAVPERESLDGLLPTDIVLIPVDGGPATTLGAPDVTDSAPVWSPDARWIAFMSDRDQRGANAYEDGSGDGGIRGFGIYVMRSDGTDVRRVIPPRDDVRWYAPLRWTA